VCRETAPGLVQAYDKYHARGVEFVSVTDIPRRKVEEFVATFDIPWACGYGASMEQLARFGAYNAALRSAKAKSATEIQPTTFLIDSDGRVLWHDDQARPRHRLTAGEWAAELDGAIEQHLR
jgi:peroxiredoxin